MGSKKIQSEFKICDIHSIDQEDFDDRMQYLRIRLKNNKVVYQAREWPRKQGDLPDIYSVVMNFLRQKEFESVRQKVLIIFGPSKLRAESKDFHVVRYGDKK